MANRRTFLLVMGILSCVFVCLAAVVWIITTGYNVPENLVGMTYEKFKTTDVSCDDLLWLKENWNLWPEIEQRLKNQNCFNDDGSD